MTFVNILETRWTSGSVSGGWGEGAGAYSQRSKLPAHATVACRHLSKLSLKRKTQEKTNSGVWGVVWFIEVPFKLEELGLVFSASARSVACACDRSTQMAEAGQLGV